MSFCAARTPEDRKTRRPPGASSSTPTRAARRRTASRARMPTMTAKASTPVARKTRILIIVDVLSIFCAPAALDLEVDHLEHDQIADDHPHRGAAEQHLGERLVPDRAVKIRRDELDDQEQ